MTWTLSHHNPDSIAKIAPGEKDLSVAVLERRPQFRSTSGHDLGVHVSFGNLAGQDSLDANRYSSQVELRRLALRFH